MGKNSSQLRTVNVSANDGQIEHMEVGDINNSSNDGDVVHEFIRIVVDDENTDQSAEPHIASHIEMYANNNPSNDDAVVDDMTIVTKSKGFGRPIPTMQDGRIKFEISCPLSDKEPYLNTVSTFGNNDYILIFINYSSTFQTNIFMLYRKLAALTS